MKGIILSPGGSLLNATEFKRLAENGSIKKGSSIKGSCQH